MVFERLLESLDAVLNVRGVVRVINQSDAFAAALNQVRDGPIGGLNVAEGHRADAAPLGLSEIEGHHRLGPPSFRQANHFLQIADS